jgi:hypothetical protein
VDSPSAIWAALAGTLLGLGGAAVITAGTEGLNESWRGPATIVGITCVVAGTLIFLLLLAGPLRRGVAAPFRKYARHCETKRRLAARYLQTLRCNAHGHEFTETVRLTPEGWLSAPGVPRRCPVCGDAESGFQALGAIPLNKEARKGRYL